MFCFRSIMRSSLFTSRTNDRSISFFVHHFFLNYAGFCPSSRSVFFLCAADHMLQKVKHRTFHTKKDAFWSERVARIKYVLNFHSTDQKRTLTHTQYRADVNGNRNLGQHVYSNDGLLSRIVLRLVLATVTAKRYHQIWQRKFLWRKDINPSRNNVIGLEAAIWISHNWFKSNSMSYVYNFI